MGQRSQIYIKMDNKLVIANYYQWNYAERMVSRARYGIENISYYIKNDYIWGLSITKLSRILDVNFDYKDVAISTDIFEEYEEYGEGVDKARFIYDGADNNDGKLFVQIDTNNKTIKYAFTDRKGNEPLTAEQYMLWEDESCKAPYTERFKKSELATYNRNKRYIEKHATIMTADELAEYKKTV